MTGLFHQIDDAVVILRTRGVFRQAKLYERNGVNYAAYGGGFIRLFPAHGGTSVPSVSLVEIIDTSTK